MYDNRIEEYVSEIKTLLDACVTLAGHEITVSGKEIRIKFANPALSAEGVVLIAVSKNGGKLAARISHLNEIMAKKDTVTLRDADAATVVKTASIFTSCHEETLVLKLAAIKQFRDRIGDLLSDTFRRTCDSKYASSFTSPKMSLTVKYGDDGKFTANFKYSRKRNGAKEVFQYSNTATAETAEILAKLVKLKYNEG